MTIVEILLTGKRSLLENSSVNRPLQYVIILYNLRPPRNSTCALTSSSDKWDYFFSLACQLPSQNADCASFEDWIRSVQDIYGLTKLRTWPKRDSNNGLFGAGHLVPTWAWPNYASPLFWNLQMEPLWFRRAQVQCQLRIGPGRWV